MHVTGQTRFVTESPPEPPPKACRTYPRKYCPKPGFCCHRPSFAACRFMNTDAPFPRTLAALRRLNARQLEFCHRLLKGERGTTAYRAAYGTTASGCARKAAAKVKAGRAVREYLDARYEELCVRDRIAREADMKAITDARTGFNKGAFITSRLSQAREQQSASLGARNKPVETPEQPRLPCPSDS